MNSSLYIGASGMKGLAEGMQVTTNNVANISTIGFKQQNILFSDLISQTQANMGDWWNAQEDSRVAIGQVGMGLGVEAVRTIFRQGPMESSNNMTDLAINGKGFFQVSDDSGGVFYTRAGDFITDNEGFWRTPTGLALNGYQLNADGAKGELAPIQVDRFSSMPPKATSALNLSFNLSSETDRSPGEDNPYFSLLENYDATNGTPLSSSQYSSSQQMTIYDAEGKKQTVTAYFDSAPSQNGKKYMEFVIAKDDIARVDEEGNALANEAGDGLLMAGVLEFDASGNLINVASYAPSEQASKDLSKWTVAELKGGNPTFSIGGEPIAVNFGLSAASDAWAGSPESAAAVGKDPNLLASLGEEPIKAEYPTTAYKTSAMTDSYKQDGYAEGVISNISVTAEGKIVGQYANGQTMELWEIPLARFTSEDGLYREGGNLFSATEASGQMELGSPGTENWGEVLAYNIEGSNVDLATEFVNMIVNQRGFQSNSKVVTTADQLLQKAVELKRS